MAKFKLKLFLEAYAILDGIPEERFDMNQIAVNKNDDKITAHSCGTVGCAMGWLGLHPKFRKLGLRTTKLGGLTWKGKWGPYYRPAEKLFGLSEPDAIWLFGPVSNYWNHKQIFQDRAKIILKNQGYL